MDSVSQGSLSQQDVEKLMSDPSPEARLETTEKLTSQYSESLSQMTESERKIAEEIFRALAQDAEVRVREAMAANLKMTTELPHDVALSLAQDVDSVSLPILQFSEVLSDEDLIAIVRGGSDSKQVAVAQRDSVSGEVADALLDSGNEEAVAQLASNEGADLKESHFDRMLNEYSESFQVNESLSNRPNLPPAISEKVLSAVSEKLHEYLIEQHDLARDTADSLIEQTRERATITLLSDGTSESELEDLVNRLYSNARLTPSLILRALCVGDTRFFEMAMSRLSRVPLKNARTLIHDPGNLGLDSIYSRADMPPRLLPAVRAAINLLHETEYDGGDKDRERFAARMIERLLTQFEDPASKITDDDIDYLMTKLKQLAA